MAYVQAVSEGHPAAERLRTMRKTVAAVSDVRVGQMSAAAAMQRQMSSVLRSAIEDSQQNAEILCDVVAMPVAMQGVLNSVLSDAARQFDGDSPMARGSSSAASAAAAAAAAAAGGEGGGLSDPQELGQGRYGKAVRMLVAAFGGYVSVPQQRGEARPPMTSGP